MREVFGSTVITDEPTPSPIVDRAGRRVLWRQTRTLSLADGTTAYGCAHCEFVSRTANSVRPHLNKHRTRAAAADKKPATTELSLRQLLAKVATLDDLTADRDRWKSRALKAERQLTTLRNALGVSS